MPEGLTHDTGALVVQGALASKPDHSNFHDMPVGQRNDMESSQVSDSAFSTHRAQLPRYSAGGNSSGGRSVVVPPLHYTVRLPSVIRASILRVCT